MPSNVLMFEFLAVDHFAPVAEHVGRKLDGIGEKMGRVGKVAAFAVGKVAVGGLAAFGYEMVKGVQSAAEYQTLQLKTAAVIKSTGNQAHISVAGIDELAHSLQETSGVSEELIINSENVLATFTNIRNESGKNNDIYDQATSRILDLSVAMGEDLQSATVQVGKALNDPVKGMTALQRVGVTFTASQKETIKHLASTGHLMAAQKIILKELNKEFGGAAKAAGSGFGGAMARVKDAVEDTFRDMATALLPMLTKVANWFADKLPVAIQATGHAFAILGGWIGVIARRVGSFIGNFMTVNDVTGRVRSGLSTLSGIIVRIGGALRGPLTAGVAIVVHYFKDMLLPALRDAGAKVFPQIRKAVETIAAAFRDHMDVIRTFGQVFMFILKVVGVALALLALTLVKVVIPVIAELIVIVLSAVGPIVRALLAITGTLISVIKGIASFAVNAVRLVGNIAGDIIGVFSNAGKWLWNAGRAIISGLINAIETVAPHIGIAIGHLIDFFIVRPFGTPFKMLLNFGKLIIGGLVFGIKLAVTELAMIVGVVIDAVRGPFKSAVTWLAKYGKLFIQGFWGGIKAVTAWLINLVHGFISSAIAPFATAGRWLFNAGRAIVTGLFNGIISLAKTIGSWMNDHVVQPVIRAVKWFFGISSPSTVFRTIGVMLIQGFLIGIINAWRAVTGWLGRVRGVVLGYFRNALGWLVSSGRHIMSGLLTGLSVIWRSINGWIGRIRGWISGHFRGAAKWLFNVGYNVLWGFLQGMAAIWKNITKWVGNIALWIRHNKGPIALDATLLIPAGRAIMQGFFNGLKSGAGKAWDFVKRVGGKTVAMLNEALGMNGIAIKGGGNSANRQLGQKMAAYYGWTGNQWAALNNLWMGESGWNNFARNPSSGAFGIPQALPPGKMGSLAASGNAAAQISWGLQYIKQVYGSPAEAYRRWLNRSPHWYDTGGLAQGEGWFRKGPQPERILSPRQTAWFERAMTQGVRSSGGRAHGGFTFILNAPNYVGSRKELLDEFNRFARLGKLDPIIRLASR